MNTILRNQIAQLNKETRQHSERVAKLCHNAAEQIGLDPDLAYRIGYLHDIGKLYIPSRIMKKSHTLTVLEREIVDFHSYYGYSILREAGEKRELYIPILYHHGKRTGQMGNQEESPRPIELDYASLLHTMDVYDAMSHKRVYHKPFKPEEIFNALKSDDFSNRQAEEFLISYIGINF